MDEAFNPYVSLNFSTSFPDVELNNVVSKTSLTQPLACRLLLHGLSSEMKLKKE
jgi:hypothetical protein